MEKANTNTPTTDKLYMLAECCLVPPGLVICQAALDVKEGLYAGGTWTWVEVGAVLAPTWLPPWASLSTLAMSAGFAYFAERVRGQV